jgi:hypothetical protein
VAGRVSYDGLVRKLKSQIADGPATTTQVREAIAAATEMGRLPVDLSGILMSLFPDTGPAPSPPAPANATAGPPRAEAGFDEPTLPYTLTGRQQTGDSQARAETVPAAGATAAAIGADAGGQAVRPAEARQAGGTGADEAPSGPAATIPITQPLAVPPVPTPEVGLTVAAVPPAPTLLAGQAVLPVPPPEAMLQAPALPETRLSPEASPSAHPPPAPQQAAATPPLPPAAGLPPLPPMPSAEPALPSYDEVQAKVDDVVLSALIGEFQGLRQARETAGTERVRKDVLDGLLVNYRSARFRSDARKAASGSGSDALKLGRLDDFAAKRAGVGSILRERFILDTEIGRGGMGVVYSAVDRRRLEASSSQPYVALKLLNDEFRTNSDALQVLEAEARKAQALAHPNIATVYDFDRDRSEVFIVMELLTGKPLSRLIGASAGDPLPGHRIALILKGICTGLRYAHRQGVVHSDLKPGNIFVTGDNAVKLLDFGLAQAAALGTFDVSVLNGLTAAYASPEMFEFADRDPRDDIFALGCIAYQLLTGTHPFAMRASNEAAEMKLEPEPIPDIDPAAWNAIRRALSFEREARTATVDEFMAGLFEG